MEELNLLAKALEETFTSKEGFKAIHGGGLFGGKAKKSFFIWEAAEKKAVLPLYFIRHFMHQGEESKSYYAIYAFSTKGKIDADTLARLKEASQKIDISTVRYECFAYSRLQLWRSKGEAFAQKNNTIATSLSDVPAGLFVYAEAVGTGKNAILETPLVVYANYNGGDYIYPIKKTKLHKINL
jgi:hypothetical protein